MEQLIEILTLILDGFSNIGGATGNAVGSIQGFLVARHGHNLIDEGHNHRIFEAGPTGTGVATTATNRGSSQNRGTSIDRSNIRLEPFGGAETRPRNAYVKYIIKVESSIPAN